MGQVRMAKTKVRTGCRTCKKRRVKCDEAKPECQRCIAGGRHCEGYEVVAPKQIAHHTQRVLLPGPRHDRQTQPSPSISADSRLSSPISPLPGSSADELHFFDYFCKFTARTISGPFSSPLFERFVLQLAHQEPLIRHAATALGALQIAQERSGRVVLSQEEAGFALTQYGKSLGIMRTMLQATTVGQQRLALVACVLFVTFEIAQRRFAETAMHLEQGLKMLVYIRHGGELPEGWDVDDGDTSDEASCLDSELMRTFDRLDVQSSMFRSTKPKLFSSDAIFTQTRRTPTTFRSLEQAREFLNAITRNIAAFQHEVRVIPNPYSAADTDYLEDIRVRIRQQLLAWNASFQSWKIQQVPLPPNTTVPDDAGAKASMEAIALSSSIMLETGVSDGQETIFDQFLAKFKLIVALAEVSRDHPRQSASTVALSSRGSGFHIHMACIPSLYLVGLKCRDPFVRRRAIRLLDNFTFREGLWDGPMGAAMLEHVCEFEEQGSGIVTCVDDVPERARLHEVRFDLNDCIGGINTYYKRRDFDGEYGKPGTWIEWTDRADVKLAALEANIS